MRTRHHRRELRGAVAYSTNNRMEMLAVILALGRLRQPYKVDLYTDSRYVKDSMTKGWERRRNLDLWAVLTALAAKHEIIWHWVRGHQGQGEHRRADKLAGEGRSGKQPPVLDPGFIDEGVKELGRNDEHHEVL